MVVALAVASLLATVDGTYISHPEWVRPLHSTDDPVRYYPAKAMREGVNGRATLDCVVNTDGSLGGCGVIAEEPTGFGFGNAALRMVHFFNMRPRLPDGASVGGLHVKVPIRFVVPTAAQSASSGLTVPPAVGQSPGQSSASGSEN